jgi:hypothetical protein
MAMFLPYIVIRFFIDLGSLQYGSTRESEIL